VNRRIMAVGLVAAIVAIVLFAVPLAVLVRQSVFASHSGDLERVALLAAVNVDADFATNGDPIDLPAVHGVQLGLYTASGQLFGGQGPARADRAISDALSGHESSVVSNGELIEAVPIPAGESVSGAVRAAEPTSGVWQEVAWWWVSLGALGVFSVVVSMLVARWQARRISRRVDGLVDATVRLGHGDFNSRVEPSGIAEIDSAGVALGEAADRLGDLVRREREFSANASHQLRTPLTGLRLTLESMPHEAGATRDEAVAQAIRSANELQTTMDDILELAAGSGEADYVPVLDSDLLLEAARVHWHETFAARGRVLLINPGDDPPISRVSPAMVTQILNVLIDNALCHGAGVVSVTARDAQDLLAFDVADEGQGLTLPVEAVFGRGVTAGAGHGIGLSYARDLATQHGARLLVTHAASHPRFTLLLPPATERLSTSS